MQRIAKKVRLFYVAAFIFSSFTSAFAGKPKTNPWDVAKKDAVSLLERVGLHECPLLLSATDKTDPSIQALQSVEALLKPFLFDPKVNRTKAAYLNIGKSGEIKNFNLVVNQYQPVLYKKFNDQIMQIKVDSVDTWGCSTLSGFENFTMKPLDNDCRGRISVNSEEYRKIKNPTIAGDSSAVGSSRLLEQPRDNSLEYVGNFKLVHLNDRLYFSAFYDGLTSSSELMAVGVSCIETAMKVKPENSQNSGASAKAENLKKKVGLDEILTKESSYIKKFGAVLSSAFDGKTTNDLLLISPDTCKQLYQKLYAVRTSSQLETMGHDAISEGVLKASFRQFPKSYLAKNQNGVAPMKCGWDGKNGYLQKMFWDDRQKILYDQGKSDEAIDCTEFKYESTGLYTLNHDSRGFAKHCLQHYSYRDKTEYVHDVGDQAFIAVNDLFGLVFYSKGKVGNQYVPLLPDLFSKTGDIYGWGIVVYAK